MAKWYEKKYGVKPRKLAAKELNDPKYKKFYDLTPCILGNAINN